ASRDRYRHAVEEVADDTGEAQLRASLRAVEMARTAETSAAGEREAHVGHYLIGRGRRDFEKAVAFRPTLLERARRFLFAHATAFYLGSISVLTASGVALAILLSRRYGLGVTGSFWVAVLAAVPASEMAIALVHFLVPRIARPRLLPRLDLAGGVPDGARTMVVVPTLLGSLEDVPSLLEGLEVRAIGNSDPRIHFAILSDFRDADAPTLPEDEPILRAAIAGIEALNAKYGFGKSDRFYLFHRERRWNPSEGSWMGWERKRGKIEEFNRLLGGAQDTSFTVRIGDPSILPSIRYVLTLDTDTRLTLDAAKGLIG